MKTVFVIGVEPIVIEVDRDHIRQRIMPRRTGRQHLAHQLADPLAPRRIPHHGEFVDQPAALRDRSRSCQNRRHAPF